MGADAVATGFEQRTAQWILAAPKGTTRQAVAFAGDPKTLPVAFDVKIIGWIDTQRDKIGHASCGVSFQIHNKRY